MQDPRVMSAGELVTEGMCTPQCLLAMGEESRGCSCRCRGKFHGSVAHTEVPLPDPCQRWWEKYQDKWDLSKVPCINQGWELKKLWNEAWFTGHPLAWVETRPPKKGYILKFDLAPIGLGAAKIEKLWDETSVKAVNLLIELLMKHGRIDTAYSPPSDYVSLYTFKNLTEARFTCRIVESLFYGYTELTDVIQGKPWPF